MNGYPLVLLGHRKREFLESTLASIETHLTGVSSITVVDDSGNDEHHDWLEQHGIQFTLVQPYRNAGYLAAMNVVFETARDQCNENGVEFAMLWEEDFILAQPINLNDMAHVMNLDPMLAQLNLQRQAVYRVERQHGYMASHHRRGYRLAGRITDGVDWVQRARPFTTNPGMIRHEVLYEPWPSRHEADAVPGGAEPAMSRRLEADGWHFGWLGKPDTPATRHVGAVLKSGTGY